MAIGLKIDPTGEAASNVVLDLNDGTKFRALKASYPTPPRNVNWSSNADTEGALPASLQYQNRTITIECRVYGSSASDLQTQLGFLEQKVGKINDEPGVGGTHEYISPSGVVCIFDLLEASADYDLDNGALANHFTTVTITFTALPFWRSGLASETTGTNHKEATLPCVIGTDTAVGGDVPALGRLVVTEEQAADQDTLLWGLQCRNYSSSVDAELFYEAETRTLLGGSELKELAGASGTTTNTAFNGLLFPTFQPILSTQKTGAGNHLAHVGTYRVFARLNRPESNTGKVSVALQWVQGDFELATTNPEKTWAANELEGAFTMTDLGLVHIAKAPTGTQRWEGRVLAKSTNPGDDIYVDCLYLFPVDEGYGALKTQPSVASLTTVSAHDEFNQTAGALDTPKAMPVGGNWSLVNKIGAEGWAVNATSKSAERAKISDATLAAGSYGIAGTTSIPNAQVSAIFSSPVLVNGESQLGLVDRYASTTSWFKAVLTAESLGGAGQAVVLEIKKNVAGVETAVKSVRVLEGVSSFANLQVTLTILSSGRWKAECNGQVLEGYDPVLATGGTLATGKAGIYDVWVSSKACSRTADNFQLLTGTADAAVYASKTIEVRSDSVQRQDSTGTVTSPRPDYKGTYMRMPPARREARTVRTIVKLSRGEIDSLPDSAIDDASFKISWQARGLVLPES